MKNEQKQLLFFIARAMALVAFAILYSIGGSGDFFGGVLTIRRWIAPAILVGVGFWVSLDWRMLVAYPFMGAALTLPYGADETWAKIGLRAVFGLACAVAYNIPHLLNRRWIMACFGAFLALLASVMLGVWNPTPDAMVEQGCIGLLIGFSYIFGAKRHE